MYPGPLDVFPTLDFRFLFVVFPRTTVTYRRVVGALSATFEPCNLQEKRDIAQEAHKT
jgi:hypothetical protein